MGDTSDIAKFIDTLPAIAMVWFGEYWEPIETAPKTGRILVWNAYFGVYSSEYVEEREIEEGKAFSECRLKWSGYPLGIAGGRLGKWYCEPTLWKPLPKPKTP